MSERRGPSEIIDRLIGVAMVVGGGYIKTTQPVALPLVYEAVYLAVALYLVLGRDSERLESLLDRIEQLLLGKLPERVLGLAERGVSVLERITRLSSRRGAERAAPDATPTDGGPGRVP